VVTAAREALHGGRPTPPPQGCSDAIKKETPRGTRLRLLSKSTHGEKYTHSQKNAQMIIREEKGRGGRGSGLG
jgi:hypothetical protein